MVGLVVKTLFLVDSVSMPLVALHTTEEDSEGSRTTSQLSRAKSMIPALNRETNGQPGRLAVHAAGGRRRRRWCYL